VVRDRPRRGREFGGKTKADPGRVRRLDGIPLQLDNVEVQRLASQGWYVLLSTSVAAPRLGRIEEPTAKQDRIMEIVDTSRAGLCRHWLRRFCPHRRPTRIRARPCGVEDPNSRPRAENESQRGNVWSPARDSGRAGASQRQPCWIAGEDRRARAGEKCHRYGAVVTGASTLLHHHGLSGRSRAARCRAAGEEVEVKILKYDREIGAISLGEAAFARSWPPWVEGYVVQSYRQDYGLTD